MVRNAATPAAVITAALVIMAATLPLSWSQTAPNPSYPVKLVRIVNPVAAGGNQDIVARAYAEQFSKNFGQQFVVENRPGNSAIVGTRFVKSAPADGYTLLTTFRSGKHIDCAHPLRQTARARCDYAQPHRAVARGANHRRSRPAGISGQHLQRPDGAGRHTARGA